MTKRYYTPKIRDFYIGFEYQEYIESEPEGNWNDNVFGKESWDEFSDLEKNLTNKKIRVKRLDWSDLLTIGSVERTPDGFVLDNDRYFTHIFMTMFSDHNVIRIETSVTRYSQSTVVVHSIVINNKSDLLRLLRQLNILDS